MFLKKNLVVSHTSFTGPKSSSLHDYICRKYNSVFMEWHRRFIFQGSTCRTVNISGCIVNAAINFCLTLRSYARGCMLCIPCNRVHVMHLVMCTCTSLQFYNNITRALTTRRVSGLVAVRGTPEANSPAEYIRARIRLARPHVKLPIQQSLAVTRTLTLSPVDARMMLLKQCKGVHAAMLFVYVTWFQVLLTKAHSPIFLRFTLVGYYISFLLSYR